MRCRAARGPVNHASRPQIPAQLMPYAVPGFFPDTVGLAGH